MSDYLVSKKAACLSEDKSFSPNKIHACSS